MLHQANFGRTYLNTNPRANNNSVSHWPGEDCIRRAHPNPIDTVDLCFKLVCIVSLHSVIVERFENH